MLIFHTPSEYTKGAALSLNARHCSLLKFLTLDDYIANRGILAQPLQPPNDTMILAALLRSETSNNNFMIVFRPFCPEAFIFDSRSIQKKKMQPPNFFNIAGNLRSVLISRVTESF